MTDTREPRTAAEALCNVKPKLDPATLRWASNALMSDADYTARTGDISPGETGNTVRVAVAAWFDVLAAEAERIEALEPKAAELTDHDHENIGCVGTSRVWPDLPEPGEQIAWSRQFIADLEACDQPLTITRKATP